VCVLEFPSKQPCSMRVLKLSTISDCFHQFLGVGVLDKRPILLVGVLLVTFIIVSSYLLVEVAKLNEELTELKKETATLKREAGEYSYNSDWVTRFVGYNPIASAAEARQLYLLLVNKAPRRSYWIFYFPEDNGLPLELESLESGSYYEVNGTFRNYAVNCPNARLTIVYSVFKNGTAELKNVKTICLGYEQQEYP